MMFKNNAVSKLMQSLLDKVVTPEGEKQIKVKNYPKMEASSQDDIDLHNSSVKTRQVQRAKKRSDDKLMRK